MVDYNSLNEILKGRGLDLDLITDNLGKPIESRIKPLVTVLNYKGYETTASCEGHELEVWKNRLSKRVEDGQSRLVHEGKRGLVYHEFVKGKWKIHDYFAHPWVDFCFDFLV